MRTHRFLPKLWIASATIVGALALQPQNTAGQSPKPAAPRQPASSEAPRLVDSVLRLGTFAIGGHEYTVAAHEKIVSGSSDAKFGATLSDLEIRGTHGSVVYRKSYPYSLQDGHFARALSASASSFAGKGGAGLVIRYVEEPATAGEGESWQLFALVGGKLAPLGVPLPPGQGSGLAVGGVLTGVMVADGVNVMPLASKAEAMEFRAWTGNFFVYVPVRVDWEQGQWGEGEQCFALDKGNLQKTGCNMRIEAAPRPPRAQGAAVRVYAGPVEDPYHVQQVPAEAGTRFEILEARAVVNWKDVGDAVACSFEDVWLRVRVKGGEGWVHSEADFAALGLPASSPPQ